MHDYNTILGVIELRLSKVSYDSVQKRYRIGRSGIALIMNRYKDSGLSLDDLRQMPASKVVDLIYPKENLRHKDIPLPDFEKIHEQMIQMGKHADLSFLQQIWGLLPIPLRKTVRALLTHTAFHFIFHTLSIKQTYLNTWF